MKNGTTRTPSTTSHIQLPEEPPLASSTVRTAIPSTSTASMANAAADNNRDRAEVRRRRIIG